MLRRERNSNIELLRILSMILIVMCHYSSHELGGVSAEYSAQRYLAGVMNIGGGVADVLFVLITGYYMCTSRFTARKLARLWGQIVFYAVLFWVIFEIALQTGYREALQALEVEVGLKQLLQAILPIGYDTYPFATSWVIMMMVSPLLNQILERLRKEQLLGVLAIATVFWSIMPICTGAKYGYSEVVWFCVLYLYAGYIRVHTSPNGKWGGNLVAALLSYGMIILFDVGMIYLGRVTGVERFIISSGRLAWTQSPVTLLCGIEVLLVGIKVRPHYNRVINTMAGAAFGVYLIHNNEMMKPLMMKSLAGVVSLIVRPEHLLVHSMLTILAIYLVCTAIDLARQATVERLWMRIVDGTAPRAQALYTRLMSKGIGLLERIMQ